MRDGCNCYFSFWTIFCTFITLTARIIKILIKKNTRRYHHFTQVYQKSWSYAIQFLRYGAQRMEVLYFIFGYFLTFHPPSSSKKNSEKWEKRQQQQQQQQPVDIIILHKCTKNHDHMLYCSWDIWCVTDVIIFPLGYFLSFYRPNSPKNRKFQKKKKNKQTKTMYQKLWLDNVQFLRYGAQRKDGRKKWRIEVGAPPKKNQYFE